MNTGTAKIRLTIEAEVSVTGSDIEALAKSAKKVKAEQMVASVAPKDGVKLGAVKVDRVVEVRDAR